MQQTLSPAKTDINSIADVISSLNVLLQDCIRTQSCAGYFAALYKRMTVAVSEGITNGTFEDGYRMEQLDIIFAKRYLQAYEAFQKGEPCTSSWQCALTGCGNSSLIVLQHLVLGINTHINLDLAIAAAAVAPGDRIHALQTDFNRINELITSLVDDVQQCLEQVWFPMRLLNRIATKQNEAVLNFSIGIARKAAWQNAVELAYMNETQRQEKIGEMDAFVTTIGERIIRPGFWPQLLLRFIRMTEFSNVAKTIRLIDTTVVNATI